MTSDEYESDCESDSSDSSNKSNNSSSSDRSGKSKRKRLKKKETRKKRKKLPKRHKLYMRLKEMQRDLREALRRDVFWYIQRLPDKLDISQTFEDQKELVIKTIIPSIMNTLDRDTYPVYEYVIYQLIHQRHRHQRENERDKKKPEDERKKQTRKKHANSRRSEKRKRRTAAIIHLQNSKDSLIKKFEKNDLLKITNSNFYHSPEISESEEEESEKNKIVTYDLQWRSDTLRLFLRKYLDDVTNNKSKGRRQRVRTYSESQLTTEVTPLNAPKWTMSGYNGPLRKLVSSFCSDDESEEDADNANSHDRQRKKKKNRR